VAEKIDRKQLKQPDAFQRAGMEAGSWVEGKEKLILGAVVAVVLLGAAIAVASSLRQRSDERAQQALGAALRPVTRPVQPGEAQPDPMTGQAPFGSQQEKDEAIVASLQRFRAEHGRGKAAATAALTMAQSLYRLGRHDEALAAYDDHLSMADKDDPLRAVALEGKGYAHEAKGDLDQALQSFEQLAGADIEQMLVGMGQYHQGRVLILQGKQEEAARILSEIPVRFPNTSAARMATERLNLLASQGVIIPEPPGAAVVPDQAG
jgi:tetratricopeptide (TPR) repeat protein